MINSRRHFYRQFSDEALMSHIREGETAAFDELYARYGLRIYSYFYRMLGGNEEIARDFSQELFLKLVEKAATFNVQRNFSLWIFSIAHNLCKNEYRRREIRKRNRIQFYQDNQSANGQQVEDNEIQRLENREFKKELLAALNQLEITQRSVFLLRFQENFSIKEIATLLGCPVGTVKSRLFYTLKKLAQILNQFNPNINEVKEK